MKKTIPHLRLGDTVRATIIERIEGDFYIVNFDGDLMRIKNNTGKKMQPGELVHLVLKQKNPLQFQFYRKKSRQQGLSVSI